MKAVYIVDDAKIAKVLIDPMRRAILGLLRQRPMTQAGLANELGLTAASLNYHMNILRSKKLVTIAKKEVERHRIMQIFFSTTAYLFVYNLDSLPKSIARYFYPVSLERARAVVVSLLMLNRKVLSSSSSSSPHHNLQCMLLTRLQNLLMRYQKTYLVFLLKLLSLMKTRSLIMVMRALFMKFIQKH